MTRNKPGAQYDTSFHTSAGGWVRLWIARGVLAAAFAAFCIGFVIFAISYPVLALLFILASVIMGKICSWLFSLSQDQDYSDGTA